MKPEYIVPVCALAVSFLAFCVSVFTILINLRQKKIDNLMSLHLFLHQADLSEARKAIREEGCEISLQNPAVRRVCSSFDFAGTMVRNGVVSSELFFQYWAIPLRTLSRPLSKIALDQTGDGVTVKGYYQDFWWLIEQTTKLLPPTS